MPDLLDKKIRKARNPHICSYCNATIEKGEEYEWSKLAYEGEVYEWKSHISCKEIAVEIWDYVEPDEGMTEEDFREGVTAVCETFICPGCSEEKCCKTYCMDKVVEIFKKHTLKEVNDRKSPWKSWKMIPKEGNSKQ